MNYSRRDVSLLLSALAASQAKGQNAVLPSKTYSYPDLPVKVNASNRQRAVLSGKTHSGFPVNLHMTELGPGQAPHASHHHVHEQMIMIHEGTLEVNIAGRISKLGPGSIAYVASGEEHGWRNVGTSPANYFVLALGQER